MQTRLQSESWPFSLDFFRFAKYLGIEAKRDSLGITLDPEIVKKTRTLYEWAQKNSDTKSFAEAILRTEGLRRELGTNYLGEELVKRLFREIEWQRLSEEAGVEPEKEGVVGVEQREKKVPFFK